VPAVESLPLDDLASLSDGYHRARKFTSCLKQELRAVEQKEDDDDDDEKELVGDYQIRANFNLCNEKLTSMAIFPDADLEMLVGGDVNGGVNVWYRSDFSENPSDQGKSCGFVPHSAEVTQVEFSKTDRSKVYSSSVDGFIRISDLSSHTVAVGYQWNNHVSNMKVRGVAGFTQREANELLLLRDDLSLAVFDPRSRSLSVPLPQLDSPADCISVDPSNRDGIHQIHRIYQDFVTCVNNLLIKYYARYS
jgi:WD40 repeat protein